MFKKISFHSFAVFCLLAAMMGSAQASVPTPFFISYDVTVYGEPGSVAYLQLEQKSPNQFVLQGVGEMSLQMEGIRKSKTTLTQKHHLSSEMLLDGNKLRPTRYEHHAKGFGAFFDQTYIFDWPHKQVHSTRGKKSWNASLAPTTHDPLSLYPAIQQALAQTGSLTFTLPHKDDLKTYTFKNKGHKTLATPLGTLDTVQLVLSEKGGERVTTLWFAPKLGFHLVKASYQEDGTKMMECMVRAFTQKLPEAAIPHARAMTPSQAKLSKLLANIFTVKK